MITYWLITWSLSHQLHVVEYENLIDNKSGEISKMLRFMGVHVEEEDVRDKLGDGFRYSDNIDITINILLEIINVIKIYFSIILYYVC